MGEHFIPQQQPEHQLNETRVSLIRKRAKEILENLKGHVTPKNEIPLEKPILDSSLNRIQEVKDGYPSSIKFETPTDKGSSRIEYESTKHEGDELSPGQRIVYLVPEQYQGRVVRDIVLKHRKDPARFSGDGWDPDGAYSRVVIVDSDGKEWQWKDPAGYKSDKFAEPRDPYNPEVEMLHDYISTVGEIKPVLIYVENVGQTPKAISNVHDLEIIFFPEMDNVDHQEEIFSPGTKFIDFGEGPKEPRYGGGPRFGGKYPGAVTIGRSWDEQSFQNNDDRYLDSRGRLHIKLEGKKKVAFFETAVGDTHPDGVPNKDGHVGTLGWAKLNVGIARDGAEIQYFMRNVNVPPSGVLAGSPDNEEITIGEGVEIVVESDRDASYLMGYRITYKND